MQTTGRHRDVDAFRQSRDLARSEILRTMIESCSTTCFLANPQIDRAAYQDLFHLTETEAERIATLIRRQQLLFCQPDISKVLNRYVDARVRACSVWLPRVVTILSVSNLSSGRLWELDQVPAVGQASGATSTRSQGVRPHASNQSAALTPTECLISVSFRLDRPGAI
jgi:hypothetical protein